ncbi:MAG: hypothetical protein NTZ48_06455 [Candidatus Omnitrophica bacterium]|nr:hypothetical protein [Candidatus Omnitrophota bacterium]
MEEIEVLQGFIKKYGSHRFKKYLGFSLKDMSDFLGVSKTFFSEVLKGKRQMPEKHKKKFIEIFNRLDIKNKTINFKENSLDKYVREMFKQV